MNDFTPGFPLPDDGTVADLLERHRLGGALAAQALLAWQSAPSQFAGPKALMHHFGTNEMKLLQTDSYANWFATPGASAGEFLGRYLPVLTADIENA